MATNWRRNLGSTLGTLGGGLVGGLAGIPGGPAGIAAGAGIGAGLGGKAGNYFQNVANSNRSNLPQNNGISAQPTTFPGGPNSPAITAQNLGEEGNALFFNRFNPQQQQLMAILGQLGQQGLQGNNFSFGPIEQQARQGFAQQTVPSIAERFSGLGAQKSSAFGQQLGQAGAGLESDLAAQKQLYNMNLSGLFQNLASLGLTPQYESIFSPKQPSFGQSLGTNIAGPAAQALTTLGGLYLMNKYGQQSQLPKP
jgi:hypothetical protein